MISDYQMKFNVMIEENRVMQNKLKSSEFNNNELRVGLEQLNQQRKHKVEQGNENDRALDNMKQMYELQ